MISIELKIFE